MRPQLPALLARLCAAAGSAQGQSTVSVYLPEYGNSDWGALRGSIISSNNSVTAYTVFCADQSPNCHLAGEIPFVFTEGAHTLVYKGTDAGTLTADLECKLDGKTAATCTGSTSVGTSHREGQLTGPTETVWTSTFTGADVTWGVLTLSTPAPPPSTTGIDGTVLAPMTSTPAPLSGGSRSLSMGSSRAVVILLSVTVFGFLLG
ncbi:uncharacterized protein P884DRAFT_244544 [Thermothelomyces heterothallicus CBS 202.75]|uniref:uncharacterized protein n=1 Tax=Thermothelomyces heterothallicus CBS 202.75 TaxID=1149848 RepID=UPI0037435F6A